MNSVLVEQMSTSNHVVTAWLATKSTHSQSAKTQCAYRDAITSFRATLQNAGRDLSSDLRAGTPGCASMGQPGDQPQALATLNQRLAILSSFYRYARSSELLMVDNPIDGVTRRRVQPYAGARPLQQAEVSERLAAIDRTRPVGMRDHALLLVGLITFRRVKELAGLRCQDVEQRRSGVIMLTFRHCKGGVEQRRSGVIMLTFRHCKGGKVMRNTLSASVSRRLLDYLNQVHVRHLDTLPPDTPLWGPTRVMGRRARQSASRRLPTGA